MASAAYNQLKRGLLDGTLDLTSDTLKLMLVDNTYTFDADHDFVDDISGDEVSGTGYTGGFGGAGRKTLANKAFSTDNANDRAEFTADAVTWTSLDVGTVRAAVVIKEITNDAASLPLWYLDLSDTASTGSDFTVTPNAEGFLQVT